MSRFNTNQKAKSTKTVNRAGGQAYKQSDKLALVSMLLTSMLKNQHYRSADQSMTDLKTLISKVDPLFVAKAAVYARNEFGMRSISHLAASEIAKSVKGVEWTKSFFEKIVRRPDDMLEILALTGKPVPNSMKKGFARVLEGLNDYSLAKYKGENKDVSMVDVVNLVHPKSTSAINALMNGTLKPAETWETKLTQAGQESKNDSEKSEMKADAWKSLLRENKLGYFALLRNLRNIIEQAPEMVDLACEQLKNREKVKRSKIFPFRFVTAKIEIQKLSVSALIRNKVLRAIDVALEHSMDLVPKFEGKTLIAMDESMSMTWTHKMKDKTFGDAPIDIASLFTAALAKTNDADVITFSSYANYKNLNVTDSVASIAEKLKREAVAGGTNFHSIFETAKGAYDRIIILSDEQGWMGYRTPVGSFNNYKRRYNCNPHIYSVDLCGYGDMQFPENQVYCVAGFSDKVFDLMNMLEQDRNILIKTIENYKF